MEYEKQRKKVVKLRNKIFEHQIDTKTVPSIAVQRDKSKDISFGFEKPVKREHFDRFLRITLFTCIESI